MAQDYDEFVEKFKPKKTTDDCYTPAEVYEAVKDWAVEEYGHTGEIVRPFWPGGDYENYDYPTGCLVLDNPPFSILSKIVRFYNAKGIDYFLFAPYLTAFAVAGGDTNFVIANCPVIYENGAKVATSFVTNLGNYKISTPPKLYQAIAKCLPQKRVLPKYSYPANCLTVSKIGDFAKKNINFKVKATDCERASNLDSLKRAGKTLFGSGFLLNSNRTKEFTQAQAQAQVFDLSAREQGIIDRLDEVANDPR
jgi:hypothetical protein